jgi:hypothetical protein
MGNLFREYQLPVLLSEDLESGGPPIRVKLLGEDLLAFRTLEGKPECSENYVHIVAHRFTLAKSKAMGFAASIMDGNTASTVSAWRCPMCRPSISLKKK